MAHSTSVVPDASMSDRMALTTLPETTERPANTGKAIGLVWPDDEDGFLRVYFTPELDHYVKVAVDDVVGTRLLDPPDAEFPRRNVYLKQDATLLETRVLPMAKQQEFLSGDLYMGIAPHLKATGQPIVGLAAFATKDEIVAAPGSVVLCTPWFKCSGDCPSRASVCWCSFNPCSRGRDCCGSLGTCG